MKVKTVDEGPKLVRRNHEQPTFPTTPRRLGIWDKKQKQREESATFIQKLVKGRAIQCLVNYRSDHCVLKINIENYNGFYRIVFASYKKNKSFIL